MSTRPRTEEFLADREFGAAREAAVARTLADFVRWLAPRDFAEATAGDLERFLRERLDAGFHPNTVRKWLLVIRSFYRWLYEHDVIPATTLLEILNVRAPVGSSARARPRPYSRNELRALRDALDERWPRSTPEDARRAMQRWERGTGSYKSLRSNAIRLQLDAVVALVLDLGLRRAELFALSVDAIHPDNVAVLVWRNGVHGATAAARFRTRSMRVAPSASGWRSARCLEPGTPGRGPALGRPARR